ncbi:MAG: hypothetical protein K2L12_00105 [Clostridia bacterium]|nr:hypothetical protein [Clostridia bacterium]
MIFEEVKNFYNAYQGKKCIIGYSFLGREIFALHTGKQTGRQIISTYAIHGREYITARLALKHINIGTGDKGCWIIPLVNPDGALISQKVNALWKANARGVDLNCNFDAGWGSGQLNTKVQGSENCIGANSFSESETSALRDFTLRIRPYTTLSFHTKGEEIYWEYGGFGDKRGAEILASVTGYNPKIIHGSAGGYKDWCIEKLHIPAYTIECGSDGLTHPITNLKYIKKCYNALKIFANEYGK